MLPLKLLPHLYKKAGWCLLIPATVLGILLTIFHFELISINTTVFALWNAELFSDSQWFSLVSVDITNTIIGVAFIAGSLLVAFSKEKLEDEYIAGLRLSSLLWAVGVNSIVLLLCFLLIYGTAFFTVMMYNMFTVPVIFIARFNYLLFRSKKNLIA